MHAFRDEADRAFEWLERAYIQRDSGLCLLKDDLLLKESGTRPVRRRFLKKMGLP